MVDTTVLEAVAARREGSSPSSGTNGSTSPHGLEREVSAEGGEEANDLASGRECPERESREGKVPLPAPMEANQPIVRIGRMPLRSAHRMKRAHNISHSPSYEAENPSGLRRRQGHLFLRKHLRNPKHPP